MVKRIKNLIQSIIGVPIIRKAVKNTNRIFFGVVSKNRLFATVYFILTPWAFNRERFAYTKGKAQYYRNIESTNFNNAHLRRNIHRIEKALIMEPRRDQYALGYIGETIDFYVSVVKGEIEEYHSVDTTEVRWATDVLTAYFNTVKLNEQLTILHDKFTEVSSRVEAKDEDKLHAPFFRKDSPENKVSYEDLLELSTRRRSVRWFKDIDVPRKLIDQALLVGRQSPSACNRQPFEYRIFDDPKMVQKVATIPFGAAGYAHNIKAIAVVVGKQDHFFSSRDRHVMYIDSSLSAMAFMFGLETVGLASSVINWPDFEPLEIKMQRTLGLASHDRVVMLIAIGYAREDGGIPYSEKKSIDSIRTYNKLAE